MFGSGTLDRPWNAGAMDPMDGARMKMAAAFEFFAKLGVPYYCFPRRDVAPDRRELRRVQVEPRRARRRRARLPGAKPASVSCGAPRTLFGHPRYAGRRRDEPRPRRLRLRGGAGQEHARGDQAPRRDELRAVGRPRRLRHAPQHRISAAKASSWPASCTSSPTTSTRSASTGTLLIEPKPMEPTKHQLRFRLRDRARLPGPQRPGRRVPPEHRGEPRHAGRAQLPPRGSPTRSANGMSAASTPTAAIPRTGWDTDQFPNSVEDLVMPLYEILRYGGFSTGGFNFDAKLRRQSLQPHRPLPCPHRRDRHARPGACSPRPTWWSAARSPRSWRRATRAGRTSWGPASSMAA